MAAKGWPGPSSWGMGSMSDQAGDSAYFDIVGKAGLKE
jgi:hypothetical protein